MSQNHHKKPSIDEKFEKKFLLDSNKTILDRVLYFFSNTFKYAFFMPMWYGFKRLFGFGRKQE